MWSRLSGKGSDKPEASSSKAQDDDTMSMKSTRRKHKSDKSVVDDTPRDSKKKSSSTKSSSRGDDRDRGLEDDSELYTNGRSRTDGSTHRSSKREKTDDDDDRKRRSSKSERARDSSVDTKKSHRRRRSRSAERAPDDRENGERSLVRRSTDPTIGRSDREPKERSRAAFDAPSSGGQALSQFPGQFNSQMPGMPGGFHRVDSDPTSQHSQSQQFPGQFPTSRPAQASHEGGIGLAAEYYNDQGESVHHQPGARPGTPIIAGTQPHLQSASQSANPPPEPSSSGGVGAAASFYSGADFGATPERPSKPGKPGKVSKPGKTSSSSTPSKISKPSKASSSSAIGAAAATAAAGYFMSGAQPLNHSQSTPTRPGKLSVSQDISPRMSPDRPSSYHTANGGPQPDYNQGTSSSHTNNAAYVAAAAGVAGLAAHEYHQHQQHSTSQYGVSDEYSKPPPGFHYAGDHHQHAGYTSGGGVGGVGGGGGYGNGYGNGPGNGYGGGGNMGTGQQHKHKGPIARLVDFFRDPEAVSQFEEYTEYIGVCRYCFDPRTSARDAPRKHFYGRSRKSWEKMNRSGESLHSRKSYEKLNGSRTSLGGIDKERRYGSGSRKVRRDSEFESDRKTSGFFKGAAAATAAGLVGKKLMERNDDFQDTSKVKTGRPEMDYMDTRRQRRTSSTDRDRFNRDLSVGVTGGSSYKKSERRESKGEVIGIGRDGKPIRRVSTKDGYTSDKKRRSSKERDSSRRDSTLVNAAIGTAIGAGVAGAMSSSRRRSSSPSHKISGVQKIQKRRDSSSSSASSRTRRRRKSSTSRPGILSGLFGGAASKKKSSGSTSKKRKEKKDTGFFGLSNASYSSTDSALVFDSDKRERRSDKKSSMDKRRRKRSESPKIKSDSDARNAVLALGAGMAALSAAQSGHSSDRARKEGLKGKHRIYEPIGNQRRHATDPEEGAWEDLPDSDDDTASVDSALAFGTEDRIRRKRSKESLSDGSSVSDKWSWRWGGKKQQRRERSDSPVLRPREHVHTPTAAKFAAAGMAAAAGGVLANEYAKDRRNGSTQDSYFGINSEGPLREVEPRPISDEAQHFSAARPGPVPIQQPQPISPVKKQVYNTQGMPDMPGGFPADDHRGAVAREEGWDKNSRSRRTTSSPPPQLGDFKGKRNSRGPDDSALVRFQFDQEQQRRHDLEEEEEFRRSQIEGVEYVPGDSKTKSKRVSRAEKEQRRLQREEKAARKEDAPASRISELQREIDEIEQNLVKLRSGEKDEAERRQILDHDELDSKTSKNSSVSPMVAAGAAAVAGGLIGKALSEREDKKVDKKESRDERKTRKRSDSKREQRSEDIPTSYDPRRDGDEPLKGKERRAREDDTRQQYPGDRQYETKQSTISERNAPKSDIDITKEELASVGLDRVTRDVMRKVRSGSRSRSPAVQHQSYAEFFAPVADLSQPAGPHQRATQPNADNDITVNRAEVPEIITVEPHFLGKNRSNSPDYDYKPDALFHPDISRLGPRFGSVPKLELIKPTPAASPSASPRIEPVDREAEIEEPQEQEREQSPPKNKVSFGDNQTHTYEARTPEYEHDSFMRDGATGAAAAAATAAAAMGAAAYSSSKSKEKGKKAERDVSSRDERGSSAYPSPGPTEPETPIDEELSRDDIEREEREWQRKHVPGSFEFDDDFTAHVAAGLGASGFDPEIVIKDDKFRKRESPPGSGDEFASRSRTQGKSQSRDTSYERRRPSDVEQIFGFGTDSPGTEGAPPVAGYVEDESIPNTPADELKRNLSRQNTSEGGKSKPISSDKSSTTVNGRSGEVEKSTYIDPFADSAPAETAEDEWAETSMSKKDKKKRSKEKRKSMEAATVSEGILPADLDLKGRPAPARVSSAVADTPESSSQSRDIAAPIDQTEALKFTTDGPGAEEEEDWSNLTKKERKKREKEREKRRSLVDDAASEDPITAIATDPTPAEDPWEDATVSKKDKKKRRNMAVDPDELDSTSVPDHNPAPDTVSEEWQETGLSKKEQKKRDKEKRRSITADLEDSKSPVREPASTQPAADEWEDASLSKKDRKKREKEKAAEAVLAAGAAGAAATAAFVDSPTTYGPDTSSKQQDDDDWGDLSKKDRKKREKEAKRASQSGETFKPEDTIRMVPSEGDRDQAELDIINDAANEPEARPELSRSDSKSKKKARKSTKELFEKAVGHNDDEMDFINEFMDDKPAKPSRGFSDIVESARSGRAKDIKDEKTRDTPSPSQSRDEFFDAEAENGDGVITPTRRSSRSRDRASTPSAAGVPLPSASGASTPSFDRMAQSQELPPRDDDSDSPSGISVAQTAIGVGEDRERRKKKKKRRSGAYDDDDTKSVVSTPGGRDSPKEEKKKGFFSGMFKKSSEESDKRRKEQADKEAAELEERERKDRKKKKHRSRDGTSTYGGSDDDSRSVVSRARNDSDDDRKSTRSGSREKRHKHRSSSRHGRGESEHRDRRDLPAKRSDAFDSQSTIRLVPDEDDPSKPRDLAEDSQSQSFLGERPDKAKPPDLRDNDHISNAGLAGLGIAAGAALAAATLPANEKELIGRADNELPRNGELSNAQDDSELPITAPTSPTKTPKHRSTLSSVSDSGKNASSPTAVPLVFRRPPNSRTSSTTTTPVKSATSAPTTPGKKDKERRPGSTEFKGKADFRPLYLVERHRKPDTTFDPEEELPALPPSESTSRASSVHEEDGTSGQPPIDSPSSNKKFLGDPIDLDAARSFDPADVLDADQPTPTVASVKADRAKREQDLLDASMQEHMAADLEWQQRQRKGSVRRGVDAELRESSRSRSQDASVHQLGVPDEPLNRAESPSSMVATYHADPKPEVREQFQIPPFQPKELSQADVSSESKDSHEPDIAFGLGAAAVAGGAALLASRESDKHNAELSPVVEEAKSNDAATARDLPIDDAQDAAPENKAEDEWEDFAPKKGKKGKKSKKSKTSSVSEALEEPEALSKSVPNDGNAATSETVPSSSGTQTQQPVDAIQPATVPLPHDNDDDLEDEFHDSSETHTAPEAKSVQDASAEDVSLIEAAAPIETAFEHDRDAGLTSKDLEDDLWSSPAPKQSKKDKKKRKSQGLLPDVDEQKPGGVSLIRADEPSTTNETHEQQRTSLLEEAPSVDERETPREIGQISTTVSEPAPDEDWAAPTGKKSKKDKKSKRKSQIEETEAAAATAAATSAAAIMAAEASGLPSHGKEESSKSLSDVEDTQLDSNAGQDRELSNLASDEREELNKAQGDVPSQEPDDEWASALSGKKSKKDKKKKRKSQIEEFSLDKDEDSTARDIETEATPVDNAIVSQEGQKSEDAVPNAEPEDEWLDTSSSKKSKKDKKSKRKSQVEEVSLEKDDDATAHEIEPKVASLDTAIASQEDQHLGNAAPIVEPEDEWLDTSSSKKSKKDKKSKRKSNILEEPSEPTKPDPTPEEIPIPDGDDAFEIDREFVQPETVTDAHKPEDTKAIQGLQAQDTANSSNLEASAATVEDKTDDWDVPFGKKSKKDKKKRKSQLEQEVAQNEESEQFKDVIAPAPQDSAQVSREISAEPSASSWPEVSDSAQNKPADAAVEGDEDEWAASTSKKSKKDKKKSKRKSQLFDETAEPSSSIVADEAAEDSVMHQDPKASEETSNATDREVSTEISDQPVVDAPDSQAGPAPEDDFFSAVSSKKSKKDKKNKRKSRDSVLDEPEVVVPEEAIIDTPLDEKTIAETKDNFPSDAADAPGTEATMEEPVDDFKEDLATPADMPPELTEKSTEELVREINAGGSPIELGSSEQLLDTEPQAAITEDKDTLFDAASEPADLHQSQEEQVPETMPETIPEDDEWGTSFGSKKSKKNKKGKKSRDSSPPPADLTASKEDQSKDISFGAVNVESSLADPVETANAEDEWATSSSSKKSKKGKKGKTSRDLSPPPADPTSSRDEQSKDNDIGADTAESSLANSAETVNDQDEWAISSSSKKSKKGKKGSKSRDSSPPPAQQQDVAEDEDKKLDDDPFADAPGSGIENEGASGPSQATETTPDEQQWESSFGSKKSKKNGKKSKRASWSEDDTVRDQTAASSAEPQGDTSDASKPSQEDGNTSGSSAAKLALGAGVGLGLGFGLAKEDSDLSENMAKNEEAVTPLPEDEFAPLTRKLSKKNKRVSWPAERDLCVEHEISAPPSGIATPAELNISIPSALRDLPPGTTSEQIPSPSWDTSPTDTRDEGDAWGFGKRERRGSQSDSDSGSPEATHSKNIGDDDDEWGTGFGKKKGKKNKKSKADRIDDVKPTENLSAIQEEGPDSETSAKDASLETEDLRDPSAENDNAWTFSNETDTEPAGQNTEEPKADIDDEDNWGFSAPRKGKKAKKGKTSSSTVTNPMITEAAAPENIAKEEEPTIADAQVAEATISSPVMPGSFLDDEQIEQALTDDAEKPRVESEPEATGLDQHATGDEKHIESEWIKEDHITASEAENPGVEQSPSQDVQPDAGETDRDQGGITILPSETAPPASSVQADAEEEWATTFGSKKKGKKNKKDKRSSTIEADDSAIEAQNASSAGDVFSMKDNATTEEPVSYSAEQSVEDNAKEEPPLADTDEWAMPERKSSKKDKKKKKRESLVEHEPVTEKSSIPADAALATIAAGGIGAALLSEHKHDEQFRELDVPASETAEVSAQDPKTSDEQGPVEADEEEWGVPVSKKSKKDKKKKRQSIIEDEPSVEFKSTGSKPVSRSANDDLTATLPSEQTEPSLSADKDVTMLDADAPIEKSVDEGQADARELGAIEDDWAAPSTKKNKKDKKKKLQPLAFDEPEIPADNSTLEQREISTVVDELPLASEQLPGRDGPSNKDVEMLDASEVRPHTAEANVETAQQTIAEEDDWAAPSSKKTKKDKKKKRQSLVFDEPETPADNDSLEQREISTLADEPPVTSEQLPKGDESQNKDVERLDASEVRPHTAEASVEKAQENVADEDDWSAPAPSRNGSKKEKKKKGKRSQVLDWEKPEQAMEQTPESSGIEQIKENSNEENNQAADHDFSMHLTNTVGSVSADQPAVQRDNHMPEASGSARDLEAELTKKKSSKKDKKKKGNMIDDLPWEDDTLAGREPVQDPVHQAGFLDDAAARVGTFQHMLDTESEKPQLPLSREDTEVIQMPTPPVDRNADEEFAEAPTRKTSKKGKKGKQSVSSWDTPEPEVETASHDKQLDESMQESPFGGYSREQNQLQSSRGLEDISALQDASQPKDLDTTLDVFDEVPAKKKGKKGKKNKASTFSWDAPADESNSAMYMEAAGPTSGMVQADTSENRFETSPRQAARDLPIEGHGPEESLPQWTFGGEETKHQVPEEHFDAKQDPVHAEPSKSKGNIASKLAMFEAAAPVAIAAEGLHRSKTIHRKNGRHHDKEEPTTPVSQRSQSREAGYDLTAPTPGRQHERSPELPSYNAELGYMTPSKDVAREPSPVDSTSKDRSSAALFSSSPSIRDTPTHGRHRPHRSIEEISRAEDLRSMRSPPATPAFDGRAGTPLMTVTEQSPEEHAAQRARGAHNDIQRSDSALRPAKRRSAFGLAEHRASTRSPLPEHDRARRLGHISGDDLHGKYEADAASSHEAVRKFSGRQERPRSIITSGDVDPNYRTFSGASVRSGESINAYLREDRPTSASPSLRHEKRSVSSDLRKAGEDGEQTREMSEAESKHGELGGNELAALGLAGVGLAATAAAFAGPSTYDPATDKGKGKITRMNDVYEAWGEQPGSPRSPSRPQSVRRRQSLQILDLEGRLDSLVSENRLLQDGKAKAERQLENTSQQHSGVLQTHQETIRSRDLHLAEKDQELEALRNVLNSLQGEVARLTQSNRELTETKSGEADVAEQYRQLQAEHAETRQLHEESTRELTDMRDKHSHMSRGMEGIVAAEVSTAVAAAVASKDAELQQLRGELEAAQNRIRALQQEILAARNASDDDVLVQRDEDYFDTKCQQLCQHVQQWVLRFSKFSDSKKCRLVQEIRDEKIIERFENCMLDGTEVDELLQDRVRRRDVFMSVVMTMIFEFVFARYLFGMDREQRQKLKTLEKTLTEVGSPAAVNKWRATTLVLLSRREQFRAQREQDTEAVVQEIFDTLSTVLPPPSALSSQITASLTKVLALAVDLSIEMRTQRANYVMLPPLQPDYDMNGDLAHTIPFRDDLMNERSGKFTDNEDVPEGSVVRVVLFPLVVKKGDEDGQGDEQEVVCPAQVLIAQEEEKRGKRAISEMPDAMKSVRSIAPSTYAPSDGGMF